MSISFSTVIVLVVIALLSGGMLALHWRCQRQTCTAIARNLQQLRLLRELLAGFQRHRGLSQGLLAGDQSLRADQEAVCEQLDRIIAGAAEIDARHAEAWSGVIDHWSRLRQGRVTDPVNNLQQHHLIIRNTIFLIEDIAAERDLGQGLTEFGYLPCIWREVVQAAEWAGQARALGVGIAAAQASSPEQRVRLRFLHQKIQQLSDTAFTALDRQPLPSELLDLSSCQRTVQELLFCMEQNLLNAERPGIEAKRYFQQATQAIDALLALVDGALAHVQQSQAKRLKPM